MPLKLIAQFPNYVEANVIFGALQSEGITCFLQDELSSTIAPFLNNGGVKLLVEDADVNFALQIISEMANLDNLPKD